MLQGGTIGALVRRISRPADEAAEEQRSVAERTRLFALLKASADAVPRPDAAVGPAALAEPSAGHPSAHSAAELKPGEEPEADTVDGDPLEGGEPDSAEDDFEQRRLRFDADKKHRIAVIDAQRTALLDARDNGIFDADLLENALDNLDATQITLQMRGKPTA